MSTFYILLCLWTYIHLSSAAFQDYYWREFSFGYIPDDAVEISDEGKYVGQIYTSRAVLPATIYPHLGAAVGEMDGKVERRENIKILCTPDRNRLYWVYVDFDKPVGNELRDAIQGGFYFDNHKYFIGRAYDYGEWRAGKVIPWERANKGLALWDSNGKYKQFTKFYILKYNSTNYYTNDMLFVDDV